jgi:molybdopterin-guanine dinucleotide biosynthesis protein A
MGGLDKGLQCLHGVPLAQIALQRLRGQLGLAPDPIGINANRNAAVYESWGVPVWADAQSAMFPAFSGPLLGFLAGLRQVSATADYLLTVPCDSPRLPLDLLERLIAPLQSQGATIAMALAPEAQDSGGTELRAQPVFCLLEAGLQNSLQNYLEGGGRKIDTWLHTHHCAEVAFNAAHDDPLAFANANTLEELRALERA